MRQAGVRTEGDDAKAAAAFRSEGAVLLVDVAHDFGGSDPATQKAMGATMDLEGHRLRGRHQRDLSRLLAATQCVRQGPRIDQLIVAEDHCQLAVGEQRQLIVNGQQPPVAHYLAHQGVGTLLLLPRAVAAGQYRFALDFLELEPRRDVVERLGGNYGADEALAWSPPQAGEVAKTGGRAEQHGANAAFIHQRPQPREASQPLLEADGRR